VTEYEVRKDAIRRYFEGEDPVAVYTDLQRTKQWFFKWLNRYRVNGDEGLKDRSRRPASSPNHIAPKVEDAIVSVRRLLTDETREESKWATIGANSIIWHMESLFPALPCPSRATINRVIKRKGLLCKPRKVEKGTKIPYPAPPAMAPNAVHQLDTVGPRYLNGTNGVEMFHSINLADCFSRAVALRQSENIRGESILNFLVEAVWTKLGLPKVLQVDNVLSIRGSNQHPRSLGTVIKVCLLLGVEVLFIPINEPQRNGVVESFNSQFNRAFFRSTTFKNLKELREASLRFEKYYCEKRIHNALKKKVHGSSIPYEVHFRQQPRLLPTSFDLSSYRVKGKLQLPLAPGKVSFIRWVNKTCTIPLFSERFKVDESLRYSYVKATIHTDEQVLRFTHLGNVVKEEPYILNQ
jgi:transposase InsO family protein